MWYQIFAGDRLLWVAGHMRIRHNKSLTRNISSMKIYPYILGINCSEQVICLGITVQEVCILELWEQGREGKYKRLVRKE